MNPEDLTPSQAIIVIMIDLTEKLRFKQPEDILKFLVCCDQIYDQLFNEKKSKKKGVPTTESGIPYAPITKAGLL